MHNYNYFTHLFFLTHYLCTYHVGGNLCVSLSMRAAEYGIRVPDSILTAYAPFNVQWVPSPSRLLSLMDPLLPTGILGACLAAYSGMGKSPFDDCTKNSIKSLTGKTSQPVNVVSRRTKTNSLLRLLRVGSKDAKYGRSSSYLEAHLQSGPESFHSCVSSPESMTVNNATTLGTEAVVSYHCANGFMHHSSETHIEHTDSDHDKDCESSSSSTGHPQSRRHSQDTTSSKPTSPQRSKHGGGDETDHIAVHYHSDIGECHVVNVVESPDSSSGELLLFPLDVPQDGAFLEVGTPPEQDEEGGHDEEPHSRTTSMSQVCLPIAKNPYMSPLLAPDEMLKSLPPIDIVVSCVGMLV